MSKRWVGFVLMLCVGLVTQAAAPAPSTATGPVTAIKAARLVDPETGTAATNQV